MFALINLMGNTVSSDAAASAGAASGASSIIMLVVMVLVFYFILIRPQKKRDKEAKEMMAALKKGDKIVTIGGIRGTIATVRENTVVIRVEDDSRIEFNKSAISTVISKAEVASEKKETDTVEAPKKAAKKGSKKAEKTEAAVEVKEEK